MTIPSISFRNSRYSSIAGIIRNSQILRLHSIILSFLILATLVNLPAGAQSLASLPSAAGLKNMTYRVAALNNITVELKNGSFVNATHTIEVSMLLDPAIGDLNGDSVDDALVVLSASGGGSGTYIEAIAMIMKDGSLTQIPSYSLGDRWSIGAISIEKGVGILQVLVHNDEDALCCPTAPTVAELSLMQDTLRLKLIAQQPVHFYQCFGDGPLWTCSIGKEQCEFVTEEFHSKLKFVSQEIIGEAVRTTLLDEEGFPAKVVITPGPCENGLSPDPYSYKALVKIHGKEYHGCGKK
jgi:uncharacterized membrane protein